MSIFKRLFGGLFGGGAPAADGNAFWLYVRCAACGEAIRVRVNREHDLSPEFDEGSDVPSAYQLRKEIVGRNCFRRIQVDMTFDRQKRPAEQEIRGGSFITREEYEAAQAAAPAGGGPPA